jgi:anti-sigma factor (TIGR02949 family)
VDDETSCEELIRDLFLLLDGEVGDGDRCAELEEHLRRCHGCLERYGVELTFKELIRSRCRESAVPVELLQKIRITLRSQIL